MASKSYPRPGYNGGSLTAAEHERLVHAALPDGLAGHPNDPAPVYADGVGVRVARIRANQIGYVRAGAYESGATDIALPSLDANNSGQTRIDTVVLRLDRADFSITEKVAVGTPAQNPVPPTLNSSGGPTGLFDFPLADLRVRPGVTALVAEDVTTRAWYVGNDGQIRCKSTTRPPHQVGRQIFETDTASVFISDGTVWVPVIGEDAGAITAPSGFSHRDAVLRRRSGMATFALTFWRPAASLAANSEYRVANVQSGFKPLTDISSTGICPSNQSVLTYSISTAGVVLINPGAASIPANRACVLTSITYPVATV